MNPDGMAVTRTLVDPKSPTGNTENRKICDVSEIELGRARFFTYTLDNHVGRQHRRKLSASVFLALELLLVGFRSIRCNLIHQAKADCARLCRFNSQMIVEVAKLNLVGRENVST